jgi:hypothetical protein
MAASVALFTGRDFSLFVGRPSPGLVPLGGVASTSTSPLSLPPPGVVAVATVITAVAYVVVALLVATVVTGVYQYCMTARRPGLWSSVHGSLFPLQSLPTMVDVQRKTPCDALAGTGASSKLRAPNPLCTCFWYTTAPTDGSAAATASASGLLQDRNIIRAAAAAADYYHGVEAAICGTFLVDAPEGRAASMVTSGPRGDCDTGTAPDSTESGDGGSLSLRLPLPTQLMRALALHLRAQTVAACPMCDFVVDPTLRRVLSDCVRPAPVSSVGNPMPPATLRRQGVAAALSATGCHVDLSALAMHLFPASKALVEATEPTPATAACGTEGSNNAVSNANASRWLLTEALRLGVVTANG